MFVHEFETHQEFETAAYLALHLPEDLVNFTEDVFMLDIHCPKNFRERFKYLCSGGTILCFSLHQTNKSIECPLRSLQIGWTTYSETFQVHINGMWKCRYKILERDEVLLGGRAKHQILRAKA